VAVGADQRIWEGDLDGGAVRLLLLASPDSAGEIFEIDLVANAGAGRHDAEGIEGALAPFEEGVALAIAVIFEADILPEGGARGEEVDHHRMIDDEIDRGERIDLAGIAAQRFHGVAHGGEVDDGRHAGEVLHQHPGGTKGDLAVGLAAVHQPFGHRCDVLAGDGAAILVTKQVFQQHLEGKGQGADAGEAVLLGELEVVIGVGPATGLERAAAVEAVERGFVHGATSLSDGSLA